MARLETKSIRLRPLKRSDKDSFLEWRNDPVLRDQALLFRLPVTEAMEEDWMEGVLNDQSKTRVVFAVEATDSGTLAGYVTLADIDWFDRTAEIGIVLGAREFQGQGFGADALNLILEYGFDDLNLHKIWLRVPAYNERAIKLYEKAGFGREGVQVGQVFRDGAYHDVVLMGRFGGGVEP